LARRLLEHPRLRHFVPRGHVAVQCTYFEKSAGRNWLVPLHQDLAIPVAARVDSPHLKGWSEKEGMVFVQAPVEVLEQLVAVRLHIDACTIADGPLRVVPGSHAGSIFTPPQAVAARASLGEVVCEAGQGAALVMRPLLLHASSKSSGTGRRRVLHYLYGPPSLPHGLRWRAQV
jgi:ectoine hydroxylase-related dioxygenase (phytanoyl-CoA dioxygenase family)